GDRAVAWKSPRDGRRDQAGGARRLADEAAGPSGGEEPLLDRSAHAGLWRAQGASGGILALREVLPAGGDEQRRPSGTAEGAGGEEPPLDRSAHGGLCREQGAGGGILALVEVLPAGGDEQRRPIGTAEGAGGDLPGPDRDLLGHLAVLVEPQHLVPGMHRHPHL